jgi:DNA-binding transcriptional LysR family regulator
MVRPAEMTPLMSFVPSTRRPQQTKAISSNKTGFEPPTTREIALLHDFSDTVAFVSVVKEGSFTAAAKVLRTPKNRISRKVRELEARLGAQLLLRTTRSIQLTEAGSVYYERCHGVVEGLEDAEHAVAELQARPSGWLRITAPYWLGQRILAPLVSEFRTQFPDVRPQLLLGHEIKDIVSEKIDVAFRLWDGPLPDSALVARRLGQLPLGVFAAPAYVRKHGEPSHPSELATHSCLVTEMYYQRRTVAWPLIRDGERHDYTVHPVAVASDPEGLHAFLLNGEGLQLTSELRLREELDTGRVVRVLPDWSGPAPTVYAVRAGGRVLAPKVKAFLEFVEPRLRLPRSI